MATEVTEQHSEIIITIKKLLPPVLKSSLTVTICSISVIWFYLSSMGRLDVFGETIGFNTLLGIVFGFTLVAFSIFCTLIFISSLMLVLVVTGYENSIVPYSKLKNNLSRIVLVNSLSFGPIIIILSFLYDDVGKNGLYFFLIGIMLIAVISYLASYFIFHRSKDNRNGKTNLNSRFFLNVMLPLALAVPSLTQIIPLSLLLPKMSFQAQDGEMVQCISAIIIFIIFAIISFFPGAFFISGYRKGNMQRSTIITVVTVPLCILVLSSFIPVIPIMVTNAAMNLSGIADWRAHHYTIKNDVYPHSMFSGKLWGTHYYADIPDRFFIVGIAMFSFGDIKLICPTSIKLAHEKNMQFDPKNSKENQKKSETFKSAAMQCFPIDKKDIKQWDSPLSDPIFYEKVRLTTPHSPTDIFQYLKKN
ncbi:hypothetical protein ACFFL1_06460 [Samsonia erythrinae]|uniref:Uncharacterized protein n=1 Tax=Samsonia erythrinae TaxID=160434 RepID=A0A4R3VQ30_9GAMM|nr:hypothetical protein [Samsonia erythrinae]TCV07600.1 hypothetical protein EDC54_102158 [Samsonia erythrinae]